MSRLDNSFRIDLPECGDKLQIVPQGIEVETGDINPIATVVHEIDIGEILKKYVLDNDTMYLNAFITIKKKPVYEVIKCPACGNENNLDTNLDKDAFFACMCGCSYNKLREVDELELGSGKVYKLYQ